MECNTSKMIQMGVVVTIFSNNMIMYSAAVWLNGCGGYYFSNNRII